MVKLVAYGWSADGRCRPCAIRSTRRWPPQRHRLGRSSSGRAAGRTSTMSGIAPTSRSRAIRGAPASGALRCSRPCRRAPARKAARSRPRGSPGAATTGTRSGTWTRTRCRCSPTPRRRRPATRCAGATRRSRWRGNRARRAAAHGAAFPWRTIRGEECSGYWPAGTAAFHVNADIADAVRRYVDATEDDEFERRPGSSCWSRRRACGVAGPPRPEGRFRIDGVTGPDEYTALVDNNVFTNLSRAANLLRAADVVEPPAAARRARCRRSEVAAWRTPPSRMVVPFDDELGVTPQSEGFTRYRRWDFASTPRDAYPLLLHYPYYLSLLKPGRQAGRPGLRPVPVRRPLHPSRSARLCVLRAALPCATRRCRRRRPSSPPRSVTSTSPTRTFARRRSSTSTTSSTTPATAFTWPP